MSENVSPSTEPKTQSRLLLLGGNRYNVPSIEAARRHGFFTIVADRNPKAAGFSVADKALNVDLVDTDALRAEVEAFGGIDGVVAMSDVAVRPAVKLASMLGLPSISEEAAANAVSKAAMRKCWSRLQDYSARFEIVETEEEARDALTRLGPLPVVLKPDRSMGASRGVISVDDMDSLAEAFAYAKAGGLPGSAIVVEQFIRGTECSAEVLIWEGKTSLLCVGENIKSPFNYRVNLSIEYPAAFSPEQMDIVAEMCRQAVTAIGLTRGVAHIEFAYTESGPILFELGARCGGGHIALIASHVSGVHEFIEACRMACGMAPKGFSPRYRRGGVYHFLIVPPGKVVAVEISDSVRERPEVLDVAVTLQEGETIGSLQDGLARIGFVVTLAQTREAARAVADWACERIAIHYEDGKIAHPTYFADDVQTAG